VVDVIVVGTSHTFGHTELITMRMFGGVEPGAAIEAGRLDDQRISFPMTDRRSPPRRIKIFRKRAPVGGHHVIRIILFPKDRQTVRTVNICMWVRRAVGAYVAPGHAVGPVVPLVLSFVLGLSQWREGQRVPCSHVLAPGGFTSASPVDIFTDITHARV